MHLLYSVKETVTFNKDKLISLKRKKQVINNHCLHLELEEEINLSFREMDLDG